MLVLDIQLEIIKRLPVKSLIQFRSACKAWKLLIDSSQFIAGYRTQSQHLMIRYEYEVKYVCYVDDDDDDTFPQQKFALIVPPLVQLSTTIVGSSHGLLCLIGYFVDKTPMVVLWNPAIRKSIAVAVPNVVGRPFNSVLGFGVCPDTKDPKLVKITFSADYRKMESIPCQVMVFTLSSGEWTCLCSNQLPRKSIGFTWSQAVIGMERILYCMDDGAWCSKAFTKLFTINPPNASVSRTLGFRKSGEPIYEIVQGDNEDICTLVVCEPCSKHIMDLGIHGNRYSSIASFYTESLLLLDYDEGHIVRCGAMKR